MMAADKALGIVTVSENDGTEVTSRPLGDIFPIGSLVVQDDYNAIIMNGIIIFKTCFC
jgi:myo-inositol-hexaphosphate 3-phosphohydrolase